MADALLASTLEPVAVIGPGTPQVLSGPGSRGTWCEEPVIVELLNSGARVVVRPTDLVHESSIDREHLARIEAGQYELGLAGRPKSASIGRPKVEACAMSRGYALGRNERLRREALERGRS